jgi:hypothetical protein
MKIYSYVSFHWDDEKKKYAQDHAEFTEYEGPVAFCGGGSSGGGTTTITYADYVQEHHDRFLNVVEAARVGAIPANPWVTYPWSALEIEDAFFGAGYVMSSFPSLYDMYGKFMAGLDIEVLWTQVFEDTVNSSVVDVLVEAESAFMDDDIEETLIPRLQTGMRDINSIMASTFVIGKALIEDARVKARNKYSAELHYRLIPVAVDRWKTHLEWNKGVVGLYAELMKFYIAAKIDVDDNNYSMLSKNALWPFTVLEFERAALGAMQGATTSKTDVAGASTAKKAISGALSGAAMGAMVGAQMGQGGGGYGMAVGAVLGGIAGAMS